MSVALCFFGLVKNITPDHVASISTHVIQPLRAAGLTHIQAFVHTHILSTISNPRNKEVNEALYQTESLRLLKTLPHVVFTNVQLSNPITTVDVDSYFSPIEHYLKHGDPWPENPQVSLRMYFRQLDSLNQVTQMLQASGKIFDLVCFLRPDVYFETPLEVADITALRTANNTLGIPSWHSYSGYNDRFTIGKQPAAIVYGSRIRGIRAYAAHRRPHAESYLKHVLDSNRIAVRPLGIRFHRVRANGKRNNEVFK